LLGWLLAAAGGEIRPNYFKYPPHKKRPERGVFYK